MKQLHSGIKCMVAVAIALGLFIPSVERRAEMDMAKIDVSRYLHGMERALHSQPDSVSCEKAIAILRRWQFDEMLDDDSRARAGILVREFESTGGSQTMLDRRDSGAPSSEGPRALELSL